MTLDIGRLTVDCEAEDHRGSSIGVRQKKGNPERVSTALDQHHGEEEGCKDQAGTTGSIGARSLARDPPRDRREAWTVERPAGRRRRAGRKRRAPGWQTRRVTSLEHQSHNAAFHTGRVGSKSIRRCDQLACSSRQDCTGISQYVAKLSFEANADRSSHPSPLLLLPSSSFPSDVPPKTIHTNTTPPPPTTLLRQQCCCRMLPDIYHEYAWILRSHEAGASPRLSLDLVRDRARHLLGDRQSDLLRPLPEIRRIFLPIRNHRFGIGYTLAEVLSFCIVCGYD